jgi:hypothetical protein
MLSMRSARPGRNRARSAAVLVPAILVCLAACSSPSVTIGTAGPAGASAAGPSSGSTPADPDADSSGTEAATGSGPGCPADKTGIPDSHGKARANDLDGDGKADWVWLADDGGKRVIGVETASGAIFSRTFKGGGPYAASAVANRLSDGTPIIVLNAGTWAALYTVVDCEIVPTKDDNGKQFKVDLGAGEYGTGVGCPLEQDELFLAWYEPLAAGPERFTVIRTRISLANGGTSASHGSKRDLGEFPYNSAGYELATGVSCNDVPEAIEPRPVD